MGQVNNLGSQPIRINDMLQVTNLKGVKNVGYKFDKQATDASRKDNDSYGIGGESTGLSHYFTW